MIGRRSPSSTAPMGMRALPLAAALLLVGLPRPVVEGDAEEAWESAAATIRDEDVSLLVAELTSPYLEGRDSPSDGQAYAARRIAERFEAFGLELPTGAEDWFHRYTRRLPAPDAEACRLVAAGDRGPRRFELGRDFVPLPDAPGSATGRLVWCGYGIDVRGFDELRGLDLDDAIAIFAEGEPRHPRALDGPELTPAANVYRKLAALAGAGAAGAIVVRRAPPAEVPRPEGWPELQPMGFRSSWASWVGERPDSVLSGEIPAIEVSEAVARELLGDVYDATLEEVDQRGKPGDGLETELEVAIVSATRSEEQTLLNVWGVVPGRDAELADEFVVIGAHFDHIGVDPRGRVGKGADDNASGTSALVELAQAFAAAPCRRSLLFCAFSSEEDGLIGSQALVGDLGQGEPISLDQIAAMVNLDMVGRGDPKSLNAIGADRSRQLDALVKKARRLTPTGISKVVTDEGQDLWQRSDHYPFADAGVPALFLFEETPISNNRDYHTWRDTADGLELEKVTRVARFAGNLVRLIAEDDDRPEFGR